MRGDLYLAAFTASRYGPELNAMRTCMAEAGKPTKVALIAIARKLLTRLNAMLKTRSEYQKTPE